MYNIRPYSKEDLPQIYTIIEKNLREVNSLVYPLSVIEFMIQRYYEVVTKDIFQTFSRFFVIENESNQELLGCAGWKPADNDSEAAYLSSMFVIVEKHGTGLGRALISAIVEDVKLANYSKIVCAASLNAVGFYEALGFNKIELRNAGSYGNVMDMERILDS